MEVKLIKEELTEGQQSAVSKEPSPVLRLRTSKGAKDRARSPDVQEPSATRVQVRGPTSPSALPALSPKGVSPPLYAQNGSSVSLSPPSITTRQLGKVKRFLTTVVQFGQDISYETGDKVKTLVLSLVSSTVSVEEFHHSLQEVTNFPLRPFVMPFLRAYLPPLQREISAQARALKMPLVQYLRQHEHAVLDPAYSASEPSEIFHHTEHPDKRRSTTDSCFENGLSEDTSTYMPPAAKRPHLSSSTVSPGSAVHPPPPASHGLLFPPLEHSALYATAFQPTHQREAVDEEWKNIHVMLNCILSMVEKTKRALGILQQRSVAGWGSSGMSGANGLSEDVKRTAADILAHTIRVTEDRIADVKRKAEEAVNEVRRQAVAELQRAVAAAESKACELVAAERTRVERLASEARKKVEEPSVSVSEVASPSPPSASSQHNACWNCGRKANETCSGCNTARYCGAFCQHKDWDTHHQVCCLTGASTSSISGRSMSQPTPTDKAPCPPFTAVAVAAASAAASSGIHANPTIKPSSPVATAAAASTSANSPSPSTPASSAPPPPPLPASSCTSSASSTSSSVSATSSPSPSGRK